jgi:tetratricopeptide (TPR) repeat protein
MKKIIIITLSIFAAASAVFANNFKDGNKLYLDGKYQDALSQYQQFIQKNPDYYEGYFNAGNALYRQEQYDGALSMYKKAQEINPKDPDIQYNIDITQNKLSQKSKVKSKKEDENKQQSQQGQQGQNGQQQQSQNGQQKQGQQQSAQQQQGQKGQTGNRKPETGNSNQPPSGMTADEVQALLNQKQNQEKRLQGYFGKQYQKQNQEPDMFNMSPAEIQQYMQKRMMDPFGEQPQQGGGQGNKKDW